jgi:hypothetical protein
VSQGLIVWLVDAANGADVTMARTAAGIASLCEGEQSGWPTLAATPGLLAPQHESKPVHEEARAKSDEIPVYCGGREVVEDDAPKDGGHNSGEIVDPCLWVVAHQVVKQVAYDCTQQERPKCRW